jgi:hypothetical protein
VPNTIIATSGTTSGKGRYPSIFRFHAFGDFGSAEHVRAWIRIARALPQVRFFGTTRMWQVYQPRNGIWARLGATAPFVAAMEGVPPHEERLHGGERITTRDKMVPPHLGKMTNLEWLKRNGWSIWNMLSEFGEKETREAEGVNVRRAPKRSSSGVGRPVQGGQEDGHPRRAGLPEQSGRWRAARTASTARRRASTCPSRSTVGAHVRSQQRRGCRR